MKKSLMNTVVVVLILSFMMNRVVFAVEKKSASHNVVASGYYWSGSGVKKFYYMDPNVGTVLNDFPSSGTVYIVASGIAYGVHCYILCY